MTYDPKVWYQWRYQLKIYYGGSQNHETSMTWAKLSISIVHKMIMWKSSAQLDVITRMLYHIMHGGSSKKDNKLTIIPIEWV